MRYNIRDMAIFLSHSPEETKSFAAQYAKTLKPGDVVLLEGEMGAGKTAFAQGVARGRGKTEHDIRSTYADAKS